MKITFLGTGTSQGVPLIACDCTICASNNIRDKRLRSSILVQVDDQNIVIDSGPDFRQQMLRTGIKHLDALVFTHAHKDHIAGMDDIRGFNFAMKKPIDVYCTSKVVDHMKREFHYIFEEIKYPGIPEVDIHLIQNDQNFFVGKTEIQPIEVKHLNMKVLGFRFDKFVYITDANFISDKEKEKIKGCEVLVLNALRIETHLSHFSLQEAIALVNEIKPKRAFFTHISHQLGLHDEIEKDLPPNIRLAYDGLEIEV
ncbi:MAG: MBL fold metallo-hydrolase [Bacteroidota bacterium]